MRLVALIPARAGSKRVPGKNTRLLCGKPLIVWTIDAAKDSSIFDEIAVFSDDLSLPSNVHACRPFVRCHVRDESHDGETDIEWVNKATKIVIADAYAILRPTSPFRTGATIRRAWQTFLDGQPADSLRAVEPVHEHPGKMWTRSGFSRFIHPVLDEETDGVPWHSRPTQTLPPFLKQNASLEILWLKTVTRTRSISGFNVLPFFTEGYEGFDINTPEDWDRAEALAPTLLGGVPSPPPAV